MKRTSWRIWRSWAIVPILAFAGCLGPQGLPKDPLFVSRRPIEGKASSNAPVRLAAVQPAPPLAPLEIASRPAFAQRKTPELPDRVLLSGQREVPTGNERTIRPPRQVPGVLTNWPPRELSLPEIKDR